MRKVNKSAGDMRESNLSPISKNARARDPEPAFSLEPHVCRHCFGRLLSTTEGDARRYVCSNCGACASGTSPAVLCACGMTLKGKGPAGPLLACAPNPSPTPEFPSLFVAAAA